MKAQYLVFVPGRELKFGIPLYFLPNFLKLNYELSKLEIITKIPFRVSRAHKMAASAKFEWVISERVTWGPLVD